MALEDLGDEIRRRGRAGYLITVSADGRPHTVSVNARWEDGTIVTAPGNRTVANAAARPLVTLLWPPIDDDGLTLLVDGAVVSAVAPDDGDNRVAIRPSGAVLHRAAAG